MVDGGSCQRRDSWWQPQGKNPWWQLSKKGVIEFNPSNINHELIHYTDDVTRVWPGFNPSNTGLTNTL
jgi:hypothetical protein